jgi:hypothetical protein
MNKKSNIKQTSDSPEVKRAKKPLIKAVRGIDNGN